MHSRVLCLCEKKKKKMMNKNWNFAHLYLGNCWHDLLRFWNVASPYGGHFHSKFGVLWIKDDRSMDA